MPAPSGPPLRLQMCEQLRSDCTASLLGPTKLSGLTLFQSLCSCALQPVPALPAACASDVPVADVVDAEGHDVPSISLADTIAELPALWPSCDTLLQVQSTMTAPTTGSTNTPALPAPRVVAIAVDDTTDAEEAVQWAASNVLRAGEVFAARLRRCNEALLPDCHRAWVPQQR